MFCIVALAILLCMVDNPRNLPSRSGASSVSASSVEIALIDFHTHSSASDGVLSPHALLNRAAREGVRRLAITDHDTINGYLSLRGTALSDSMPDGVLAECQLVSGAEFSCQWGRLGIHIVALGFDPNAPNLRKHLARLDTARSERAVQIAQRLERAGMPGGLAGARELADGAQIGRPHFARWMVEAGHIASEELAFKRFLGRGKAGDIAVLWPSLGETVTAICDSGGIAVLAHPLEYKMTATRLRALTDAFCEAGGKAIEVINGRPRPDDQALLWRIADQRHLLVSVGSDFHRDSTYGARLGVDVTGIPNGRGVWESL